MTFQPDDTLPLPATGYKALHWFLSAQYGFGVSPFFTAVPKSWETALSITAFTAIEAIFREDDFTGLGRDWWLSTAFGLNRWLFCKVYIVTFRIPHDIFVGPGGLECLHELHGLFKLVAGRYVQEFAITKLYEHAIHGTGTSHFESEYRYSTDVTVMKIIILCDQGYISVYAAA